MNGADPCILQQRHLGLDIAPKQLHFALKPREIVRVHSAIGPGNKIHLFGGGWIWQLSAHQPRAIFSVGVVA